MDKKKQQALAFLKSIVDEAVKRGMFATADDVYMAVCHRDFIVNQLAQNDGGLQDTDDAAKGNTQ